MPMLLTSKRWGDCILPDSTLLRDARRSWQTLGRRVPESDSRAPLTQSRSPWPRRSQEEKPSSAASFGRNVKVFIRHGLPRANSFASRHKRSYGLLKMGSTENPSPIKPRDRSAALFRSISNIARRSASTVATRIRKGDASREMGSCGPSSARRARSRAIIRRNGRVGPCMSVVPDVTSQRLFSGPPAFKRRMREVRLLQCTRRNGSQRCPV